VFRTFIILSLSAAACRGEGHIVAVNLDGVIHPITVDIITHAIEQAAKEHASLVLIRLNTPGGLADATRQCTQRIAASSIPVVTFVTPTGARAASAGFFLLLAGDIAAMAAGTNTGAAAPVLLGKEMDATMRRKVESDAAAALRSLASQRGRNAELAEKAVLESRSFTDAEALKNTLIDLVVRDERQLLAQLDGREVVRLGGQRQIIRSAGDRVIEYRPPLREQIISSVADPNIAFILLILGVLGIYIELSFPGMILPGVAGALSMLLGLSGIAALPINWLGVALLLLAVLFFVLELKVTSHGVLGIGGTIGMILGALLLIDAPPEMRIRLSTALAVTLPFTAITLFLLSLVLRARSNKVITGMEAMGNEVGVARTDLTPGGKVYIRGEYWDAVCSITVPAGTPVRVTAMEGLTLKVDPVA
jgi:membrane-bound serine protease (ClpP class)